MSVLDKRLNNRTKMSSSERSVAEIARGILREVKGAVKLVKFRPGNAVLLIDIVAYRLMTMGLVKPNEKVRKLTCRRGFTVSYTRNRGDLFTIGEIFYGKGVYQIPPGCSANVIVDLGANIGLASLNLYEKHRPTQIICVEPSHRNANLLRRNIEENELPATVLEGVIADRPGELRFESGEANGGHIGSSGEPVRAFSMDEVLALTPNNYADVVKVDIEGYEEVLLRSNNEWLHRVGCLFVEFHDSCGQILVDKPSLVAILEEKGFEYLPKEVGLIDTFVRSANR